MRWPWYAAGDAAAMAMRAAASVLAPGSGALWLVGNVDEGADHAAEVMASAGFARARVVATSDGTVFCSANRSADADADGSSGGGRGAGGFDAWRSTVQLVLPASSDEARGAMAAADGDRPSTSGRWRSHDRRFFRRRRRAASSRRRSGIGRRTPGSSPAAASM